MRVKPYKHHNELVPEGQVAAKKQAVERAEAIADMVAELHGMSLEELQKTAADLLRALVGSEETIAQAGSVIEGRRQIIEKLSAKVEKTKEDRRRGPATRLANDPKQAAKACALALWVERYNGKHPKLRTVEQFATEVMRRWPVLTSSKVICGWSAKWTKEVKAGRTPAC